ncbi:hypothetical protein JCM10213_000640 [Rhodosporidiobolus nylandii]
MACTCRSALSAIRQSTPRVAVAPSLRSFSSSPLRLAAAPATAAKATSTSSPSAPPPSSCPPGTVLKGLNYLKDGSDPVAKEDSEYPAWLWTITAEEGSGAGKEGEAAQLAREKKELKKQRKVAIKAANSLKG